jgi:hypothetical protein
MILIDAQLNASDHLQMLQQGKLLFLSDICYDIEKYVFVLHTTSQLSS